MSTIEALFQKVSARVAAAQSSEPSPPLRTALASMPSMCARRCWSSLMGGVGRCDVVRASECGWFEVSILNDLTLKSFQPSRDVDNQQRHWNPDLWTATCGWFASDGACYLLACGARGDVTLIDTESRDVALHIPSLSLPRRSTRVSSAEFTAPKSSRFRVSCRHSPNFDTYDLETVNEAEPMPVSRIHVSSKAVTASAAIHDEMWVNDQASITPSVAVLGCSDGCTMIADMRSSSASLLTRPPMSTTERGIGRVGGLRDMTYDVLSVGAPSLIPNHTILTGSSRGDAVLWDLRRTTQPLQTVDPSTSLARTAAIENIASLDGATWFLTTTSHLFKMCRSPTDGGLIEVVEGWDIGSGSHDRRRGCTVCVGGDPTVVINCAEHGGVPQLTVSSVQQKIKISEDELRRARKRNRPDDGTSAERRTSLLCGSSLNVSLSTNHRQVKDCFYDPRSMTLFTYLSDGQISITADDVPTI